MKILCSLYFPYVYSYTQMCTPPLISQDVRRFCLVYTTTCTFSAYYMNALKITLFWFSIYVMIILNNGNSYKNFCAIYCSIDSCIIIHFIIIIIIIYYYNSLYNIFNISLFHRLSTFFNANLHQKCNCMFTPWLSHLSLYCYISRPKCYNEYVSIPAFLNIWFLLSPLV